MRAAVLGAVALSGAISTIAVIGCRRGPEITAAPARERPRDPEPPPGPTPKRVTTLVGHVGDDVTIEGRLVKGAPKVLTSVAGKEHVIVDVDDSHLAIVTYVAERPTCPGTLRVVGKVIVAAGMARSGKTEGYYAEPQLDAERWECRE